MRKTNLFKNPLTWIITGAAAIFVFSYGKAAYLANNLKPILKRLSFKVIDLFTSTLTIDFSLYNSDASPVIIQNIKADVFFNNVFIGYINNQPAQTIQPASESPFSITIKISNLSTAPELFNQLKSIAAGQPTAANIKVSGTITANSKLLPLTIEQLYNFNQSNKTFL
jgi:LEA14-like dessication related protein